MQTEIPRKFDTATIEVLTQESGFEISGYLTDRKEYFRNYMFKKSKSMKAIWNGEVLAESDNTKIVEDNHYFPPEAIKSEYFLLSSKHTTCPWKGKANYFHVEVDSNKNPDAAWFYPHPSEKASDIKNHVAFWNGVEIVE